MDHFRLPPLGKNLYSLIQSGQRPVNDVYLFIGTHSWEKAKGFYKNNPDRTLMLPAWLCADDYYWPVSNCSVLVFDTGGYPEDDYIKELALCLFRHGANIVRLVSFDSSLTVFTKE